MSSQEVHGPRSSGDLGPSAANLYLLCSSLLGTSPRMTELFVAFWDSSFPDRKVRAGIECRSVAFFE